MRRAFSVFCLCTWLLVWSPASAVSAQEPDPTQTPAPIFVTPTPLGTLVPWEGLRPCPEGGVPVGWGTIKPSPRWLIECAHCIPEEAFGPTVTPVAFSPSYTLPTAVPPIDVWATPVAGLTPTPEATATPVPALPDGFYVTRNWDSATVPAGEWQYWEFDRGSEWRRLHFHFPTHSGGCVGVQWGGWASGYVQQGFWRGPAQVEVVADPNGFAQAHQVVDFEWQCEGCRDAYGHLWTQGQGPNVGPKMFYYNWYDGDTGTFSYDHEYAGRGNICVTDADGGRPAAVLMHSAGGSYSTMSGVGSFRWITATFENLEIPFEPFPDVTPTPVGTVVPPAGYDYCFVVEDIESLGPEQGLPEIAIGRSMCYGTTGIEFTLPLVGDVSLPSLSVCFDQLTLGSVQFLGVELDMDLISAAVAGIAVLRLLFRS